MKKNHGLVSIDLKNVSFPKSSYYSRYWNLHWLNWAFLITARFTDKSPVIYSSLWEHCWTLKISLADLMSYFSCVLDTCVTLSLISMAVTMFVLSKIVLTVNPFNCARHPYCMSIVTTPVCPCHSVSVFLYLSIATALSGHRGLTACRSYHVLPSSLQMCYSMRTPFKN